MSGAAQSNSSEPKSHFEQLVDELRGVTEGFSKALPPEGDAAAEGDAPETEEERKKREAEEAAAEAEKAKGGGKPFGKSMTIDGEDVQVIEADELMKSLNGFDQRVGAMETTMTQFGSGVMSLLKSLTDEVASMRNAGRGRKAVVTIAERPAAAGDPLAKSDALSGLSAGEFMAKCDSAFSSGKISALDVSIAETAVNRRGNSYAEALDPAFVRLVTA